MWRKLGKYRCRRRLYKQSSFLRCNFFPGTLSNSERTYVSCVSCAKDLNKLKIFALYCYAIFMKRNIVTSGYTPFSLESMEEQASCRCTQDTSPWRTKFCIHKIRNIQFVPKVTVPLPLINLFKTIA